MSHKAKIFIIVALIIIVLAGIGFLIWQRYQAETIYGCQSTRAISSVVGSPGSNLVTYNLFGHDVSVNQIITPFLDNVQKQVIALKTGYSFDDIQTYNYRSVRGGGGLSLHSFGIALDINPGRNAQGSGRGDIPQSIIDTFHANGFFWGGEWEGRTNDPMHFEWYGAEIAGNFVDAQSKQRIASDVAATVDSVGVPISNGYYRMTLDSLNAHKFLAVAKGYQTTQFDLGLECFQNRALDVDLTALPDNTPGSISGKVTFANNRAVLIPATIYLDGGMVGTTDLTGGYTISNVRKGPHTVSAQILMFPGASITTSAMAAGENLTGQNIVIGK